MMTKKQKITIASVAGACVIVLAAAIICIVLFLGGGEGNDTQPVSVSTVSSLEETVPAQSEETSQAAQETSSVVTESQPDAQAEQPGQGEEGTTPQQTTQTAPQATTPAATTSTPAAPTASAPAATAPSTPTQPSTPSQPAQPSQPSLEDQIAEFNARAPQIIQLAYQKLADMGVTSYTNMIDPATDCWAGTSDPAPWQDWFFETTWSDERCAEEFVDVIKTMWELDGRKVTGVQIEYLGANYGNYIGNTPVFRIYNWQ